MQHCDLIQAPVIAGDLLWPLSAERRVSKESERAKSQIVTDEQDALWDQSFAVVSNTTESWRPRTGQGMIAAARKPDHDRQ
jgi:hypothetical protein